MTVFLSHYLVWGPQCLEPEQLPIFHDCLSLELDEQILIARTKSINLSRNIIICIIIGSKVS